MLHGLRSAANAFSSVRAVSVVLPFAIGVRFQEEIGVAVITVRLMPAFVVILIPHLMLRDDTIIMIALFAMGLMPASVSPSVIMGFRGLRAAFADALAGVVVNIRPGVAVGSVFRLC